MIEAPFSEDLDYSSDYLDEFHGREAYYDSEEDQPESRFADENLNLTPIDTRQPPRFEEFKTADGFTVDNDTLFHTDNSLLKTHGNISNLGKEESKSQYYKQRTRDGV